MKKYLDEFAYLHKIGEGSTSSYFKFMIYIDIENQFKLLPINDNTFGDFPEDAFLTATISLDFELFSNVFCGYRVELNKYKDVYRYEDLNYSKDLNGHMLYLNDKRTTRKRIENFDIKEAEAFYQARRLMEYFVGYLKEHFGINDLPKKTKLLESFNRGVKWYE